jgi:hypothetical protein
VFDPAPSLAESFPRRTRRNLENSRRHEIDEKDLGVKHGPKAACADG